MCPTDVIHNVLAALQANFHTDCRGMQAQLLGLSSLMSILDPQLTSFLVRTNMHIAFEKDTRP